MKHIGAHVSAAGGVENAPVRAKEIGANAFALFTKNQRQWNARPLSKKSIECFKANCHELGFSYDYILPHNSYLVNMGNPDAQKRLKSQKAFLDEMQRCEQLGIKMLNFHPGSHLNAISIELCIDHIVGCVNEVLEQTKFAIAVIENTAGQRTNIGYRFEHLAAIISGIKQKDRVGVCLDTAHLIASGYEIRTPETYNKMWEDFDKIIGAKFLKGIHLNDSKKELATRVDRHEVIGEGVMGEEFFKLLMNDQRLTEIPIILETPDETKWAEEIRWLRTLEE